MILRRMKINKFIKVYLLTASARGIYDRAKSSVKSKTEITRREKMNGGHKADQERLYHQAR